MEQCCCGVPCLRQRHRSSLISASAGGPRTEVTREGQVHAPIWEGPSTGLEGLSCLVGQVLGRHTRGQPAAQPERPLAMGDSI